jgi:FkbH-like protein
MLRSNDSTTSPAAFAVAATFTAEPLEPALAFWFQQLGEIGATVSFAPFNQVFQALLDPASAISTAPWARAVLVRFEDWIEGDKSGPNSDRWAGRLRPLVDEFLAAMRSASGRAASLLVVVCPPSQKVSDNKAVADLLASYESHVINSLANQAGVFAFPAAAVTDLYPINSNDIHDPRGDAVGRIAYTPAYFTALATFLVRMAHAVRRPPVKVIALDCDNTLWQGVCGEGAVTVAPPFAELQRMMMRQSANGRLICLCSKNVEQDVFDVFDQHPDMLLKRDALVGWRINWSPKSENLRSLAKELNLGLDSFVFLDDNPVECAEVRANCPEILTLQLPQECQQISTFLRHVWAFDQFSVTDQDRKRTASYIENARREQVRRESSGLDDFLAKLNLQIDIAPVSDADMPRAAQLTERTNQFNASTIRRTQSELAELLRDGRSECFTVKVKDRFGDYGLVGMMIVRPEGDALLVDTLLLSCRVLGRGVEHRMLNHLGERARAAGLTRVDVRFVRSKKNQPMLDFLESVAAAHRDSDGPERIYRIATDAAAAAKATASPSTGTPGEGRGEGDLGVPAAVDAQNHISTGEAFQDIASRLNSIPAIIAAIEQHYHRSRESSAVTEYVEPRNETERKLACIWCKVLDLDRVGVNDDYFALGGTSVRAVRLVLDVESTFGRPMPINTLLRAPTIAQLAQWVEAAPSSQDDAEHDENLALVTFRAEGDEPPLFLLPGIGGHAMSYRKIANWLPTRQPVYGIEMRPDRPENQTPRTLEQIATEFLDRIRRVQPSGTFFLAGWSFGGAMAFEVARQLKAMGESIGAVVLFDTYYHGYPRQLSRARQWSEHLKNLAAASWGGRMVYVGDRLKALGRTVRHKFLRAIGVRRTDFYSYESPQIERMVHACDQAWQAYRAKPLDGKIVLIRATRLPDRVGVSYDDPFNGWGGLASGGIDVRPIDADHLSLFEPPADEALAHILSDCLRDALEHSSSAAVTSPA